jgi:PAS domain S-box-containing protein
VINDFLTDQGSGPWREELLASGLASIAAFPIRQAGEVRGALVVYASEKEVFGTQEAALLEEAAMDISFALDHLAGEERRREAEAALQESERFLHVAQEAGGIGIYTWYIQENRWQGSATLDRIFGIDDAYVRDLKGWAGLVAPDFRAGMQAYVAGIIARRERFDLDYPIVRASDGERRWVHGTGELLWDEAGQPVALTGAIQDITERKQAEATLRSSEEKFSKAFHASPDSVNINRLSDGVYLDINDGFTRITGYTAEDVLGRSSLPTELGIWVRAEDRLRLQEGLRRDDMVVGPLPPQGWHPAHGPHVREPDRDRGRTLRAFNHPGHHRAAGPGATPRTPDPNVRGPEPGEPGHCLVTRSAGAAGQDLRSDGGLRQVQHGLDRLE